MHDLQAINHVLRFGFERATHPTRAKRMHEGRGRKIRGIRDAGRKIEVGSDDYIPLFGWLLDFPFCLLLVRYILENIVESPWCNYFQTLIFKKMYRGREQVSRKDWRRIPSMKSREYAEFND